MSDSEPELELERCTPLDWPGAKGVDERFVRELRARLRRAALGDPFLLGMFGVSPKSVLAMLAEARVLLAREKTVGTVDVPVHGRLHVLGDLHGDFFSLMAALRICGLPSDDNRLVIAGDLVDRGPWGVEILLFVFVLKLWRPSAVMIVRGNHETTGCVSRYGFEEEVMRKYGRKVFNAFMAVTRELPLAMVVQLLPEASACAAPASAGKTKRKGGKPARRHAVGHKGGGDAGGGGEPWELPLPPGGKRILVVHGGLWRHRPGSLAVGSLRDLAAERRQVDDPQGTLAEDVLWSDPAERCTKGVRENCMRGAGLLYGCGAVDAFLRRENLCMIVRAHEGPDARRQRPSMGDMLRGHSVDMSTHHGPVVTLFSSARYCGFSNEGAVATFTGRGNAAGTASVMPEFTTFDSERPADAATFCDADDSSRPTTPRSMSKSSL